LDINPTYGVFFMARHSESLKLELVQRYLSGSVGHKALASQYGVGRTSLHRWIASYREHGEKGLSKKYSRYSAQFKLSVLQQMQRQGLSQTQVAALFDLRGGPGVVAKWLHQYHEGGPQALNPKRRGRPKTMPTSKPPKALPPQESDASALEALRKENEYLRAEVAYLKKLEALVQAKRQAAPKERKPSSS
jgi:transposase